MAANNLTPLKELPKNPSPPLEELPKNPSPPLEELPKNPSTLEEPPTSVGEEELVEAGNEEAEEEEEEQGSDNNGDLLATKGKNESFQEEEIQEANSNTPTLKVKAAAKANKRPIEKNNVVVEESVSKRAKKKIVEKGDDEVVSEKKSGFINKKWSDADEVVILEGMIEFKLMGKDNRSEFYNFITKSLEFDCNRKQLTDKIIKLKSKYGSKVMKGKGKTQFLDAHNSMCFQLSKKIWGIKGKDSHSHLVKRKLKFDIDLDEKRLELEKKWAELKLEESQIFLWRCELIAEQRKLVLDAYKVLAP